MSTPWLFALANMDILKGPGGNEADGMRYVSLMIAAIIIPLSFWWFMELREPAFKKVSAQAKAPFWQDMKRTANNHNFVMLTATIFTLAIGFNFVSLIGSYIPIFFIDISLPFFEIDKDLEIVENEIVLLTPQSPYTLLMMRVVEIGIPLPLSVFSVFFIFRYTLTERRSHEIKDLLRKRHSETRSLEIQKLTTPYISALRGRVGPPWRARNRRRAGVRAIGFGGLGSHCGCVRGNRRCWRPCAPSN